jgi:tellurite resistance-related uncharacterized protein
MWTGPDENFCFDFDNLENIRTGFEFSGSRYKEYAAIHYPAFRFSWMVKPAVGFISDEHEHVFRQNWSANAAKGVQHRIRANLGDMAYASGRVYEDFDFNRGGILIGGRNTIPDSRMPFTGERGPDAARIAFELVWGGEAKPGILRASRWGKAHVLRLDIEYGQLEETTDEQGTIVITLEQAQQQFMDAHPGYRYEDRRALGEPTNIFGERVDVLRRTRLAGDMRFVQFDEEGNRVARTKAEAQTYGLPWPPPEAEEEE